jgi:hypothetical protein
LVRAALLEVNLSEVLTVAIQYFQQLHPPAVEEVEVMMVLLLQGPVVALVVVVLVIHHPVLLQEVLEMFQAQIHLKEIMGALEHTQQRTLIAVVVVVALVLLEEAATGMPVTVVTVLLPLFLVHLLLTLVVVAVEDLAVGEMEVAVLGVVEMVAILRLPAL